MTYPSVTNFEKLLDMAAEIVRADGTNVKMNFLLQANFSIELLKSPQLLDVSSLAYDWQSTKSPDHLHFSHGEFIGEGGVQHIIAELQNKPDSNRALMSLISQQHLLQSGDTPIPSFMVLQFSRIGETLYVSAYFRALEVSRFLRINLEEIRQVCEQIRHSQRNIHEVNLTIFAFRAYHRPDINTLEVPRLDRLKPPQIMKRLEKSPCDFATLIRDKKKHSTAVTWKTFEEMLDILKDKELAEDLPAHPNLARVISLLENAISTSKSLSAIRKTSSHHSDIEDVTLQLTRALDELASEFEKWK